MDQIDICEPFFVSEKSLIRTGLSLIRYLSGQEQGEAIRSKVEAARTLSACSIEMAIRELDFRRLAVSHCEELCNLNQPPGADRFQFVADPVLHRTSLGAVGVLVQQMHRGIPIFQAAQMVCFGPDGSLWGISGTQMNQAPPTQIAATVSAVDALQRAVRPMERTAPAGPNAPRDAFGQDRIDDPIHSSDHSEAQEPVVLASFPDKPDCAALLDMPGLGDVVPAKLVWFPMQGNLHLAWHLLITTPKRSHQYRILIDAGNGEIVYCRDLVRHVAARGIIFFPDGNSPPQRADFPEPLSKYGLPLPSDLPKDFPYDWVMLDNTAGRHVSAEGSDGKMLGGQANGGVVVFEPNSIIELGILNLFYLCSYLHDFFCLLGVRDELGVFGLVDNACQPNPAPLIATLYTEALDGTTGFVAPADGSVPVINMGPVHATGRHTALDASVVFHEYSHFLISRLIGGPFNDWALDAIQSAGMEEGWSDYFACSATDTNVIGSWVSGRPDGIRGYPYDDRFPDDFGKLGTGRYVGKTLDGTFWPHPIGEIWCAALLEMNRKIGKALALQLVVDGLKLTPANPSFLQGRDAIVLALQAMFEAAHLSTEKYQCAWSGIWSVFARFGMGRNAESRGATLEGIVADFEESPLPPSSETGDEVVRVAASPDLSIPDGRTPGVEHALKVNNGGWIKSISLWVDIAHPFIGDLQVDLITPQSTLLNLHNRGGGSSSQLKQTWGSSEGQPLDSLVGKPAAGTWALRVIDHKAPDSGTLRRWGMEIVLGQSKSVCHEWTGPLRIPDGNPVGVQAPLEITAEGAIESLHVSVDVTHSRLMDVTMTLITPNETPIMLNPDHKPGAENLVKTWSLEELAGSRRKILKQPVSGVWRLQVRDCARGETGTLNRWSLAISARHH